MSAYSSLSVCVAPSPSPGRSRAQPARFRCAHLQADRDHDLALVFRGGVGDVVLDAVEVRHRHVYLLDLGSITSRRK